MIVNIGFVLGAHIAQAAGTCSGGDDNYFDGYFHDAVNHPQPYFEGSSGYIVVRDGALCNGQSHPDNFSNAWVMIAANEDYFGWAQVGFERAYGAPYALRWFSEFWAGNVSSTFVDKCSTFNVQNQIGVRHTFRVLWDQSCLCLRANIDTTRWDSSPFNPFNANQTNWGPEPFVPQFETENGYLNSDVPGSTSAQTAFSGLGAQQYFDDTIVSMPCTMILSNDDPARRASNATSCIAFPTWTKK